MNPPNRNRMAISRQFVSRSPDGSYVTLIGIVAKPEAYRKKIAHSPRATPSHNARNAEVVSRVFVL